jgi:DNA-binding MarR family transcriptional regulator
MSKSVEIKPIGCTNLKLRQLTRRVSQHYDAYLALVGIKTTQYSLLSTVQKLGPIQPSALARILEMDLSTLSRNMRPLIDRGLLVLSPGADARSRQVVVTEVGRALRDRAQKCWRAAQESINGLLGSSNVNALHALVDQSLAQLRTSKEKISE